MWWAAAETASAASDPTLALIAAAGSVLTASLPVLISKMRDNSRPGPESAKPEPAASGKHHRDTDAPTLVARIDDGQTLLNRLISDVQRRAEAAETEVRLLREQKDSLEALIFQQRLEIQTLRNQIQSLSSRGMT